MAFRFKTYTELGDAVKQARPELADKESESVGLRFADRYGDQYRVVVEEEGERAPFEYDPEEGFNVLKTLGNVPWSAGQVVGDIASAVTSPLETLEGLGRGVAGAAEMAMGTEYSPENIRVAQQMGEGIAGMAGFDKKGDEYEFTGRGIQERPLDAGSLLAGGAGAAAKGVSMAGRATGLSRLAKGAETVGKAAQIADPTMAVPRAGVAAARGAGRLSGRAAKAAAAPVVKPIKNVAERTRKYFDEMDLNPENPLVKKVMAGRQRLRETANTALESIRKAQGKGAAKVDKASETVFGEKPTAGNVARGLAEQFFGFSFGVGPRVVGDMMDISTAGGDNLNTMLRVIRHDSDADVAREIIDDVNVAVKKYAEDQGEIHRQMREPLQMDRVLIDSEPIRQRVQQALTPLVRYSLDEFGRIEKGSVTLGDAIATKPANRTAFNNVLKAIFDKPEEITAAQLDDVKQLIDDNLYDVNLTPQAEGTLKTVRGEIRGALGDFLDDPEAVGRALRQVSEYPQVPGAVQGIAQVEPNLYSAAMRQYFDFQDRMNNMNERLRVVRPDVRTFNTLEEGVKVQEEVLRQPGKDIEILRAMFKAFDDDTGLALETLKELAVNGGKQEIMPKIIGMNFRPALGGGLVVRAEISQAARAGFGALGAAQLGGLIGTIFSVPMALATFSPKYGGQLLSWAVSPAGRNYVNTAKGAVKTNARGALDYMKRSPQLYQEWRQTLRTKLGRDPTPADELESVKDIAEVSALTQRLNDEQLTIMRDLLRTGAMEQRAEQAGEQAQQRNLLTQLSNVQAR
jgi:hypothetical protein